jgi:hypothetical protein
MGTSFATLNFFFFLKSPLLTQIFHLSVRRCVSVAYNSAESLQLLTHAVCQQVVVPQKAPSECNLQEDKRWKSEGARDCREDEGEQMQGADSCG